MSTGTTGLCSVRRCALSISDVREPEPRGSLELALDQGHGPASTRAAVHDPQPAASLPVGLGVLLRITAGADRRSFDLVDHPFQRRRSELVRRLRLERRYAVVPEVGEHAREVVSHPRRTPFLVVHLDEPRATVW